MKMEDSELINTIRKQNKIEGSCLRILNKIVKDNDNQSKTRRNGESSVLMEVDEELHEMILQKGKLNVRWKKSPVFYYIGIERYFKCWGYYHIAKNCTRKVTCHKCARNHEVKECTTAKKKCVNCMFK